MSVLVKVAIPLPIEESFSYVVPLEMEPDVAVGKRVLVPFGSRRLTGVIVNIEEGPANDLKSITDVLDEVPSCTPGILALTRWVADYYVCSWGEAIRAALPPGMEVESRRTVHLAVTDASQWPNEPAARAVRSFLEETGPVPIARLTREVSATTEHRLRRLHGAGLIVISDELRSARVKPKMEVWVRLEDGWRSAGRQPEALSLIRGERQGAVLSALYDTLSGWRKSDLMAATGASSDSISSLAKKGFIELDEREVRRDLPDEPSERAQTFALHEEQEAALKTLEAAITAGRFQTFLLHGITGSGKTEVYIAAMKRVIALGKTCIILVPEISLTPQTVRRFRSHFGGRVAVMHSRMSMGERYDAWRAIRDGRHPVVIGPRSAIFAPLDKVGLIIVDEEHEASYKQFDPAPRYHARDVAVVRAQRAEAICILGSATPSLETYANARGGKYGHLRMDNRVPLADGKTAQLPQVRVVNLALEYKKRRLEGSISIALQEAIAERLRRSEQVILLQNRRGYASVLECRSCGFSPGCRDCAVTLTFHKARRQLRCHYCGLAHPAPVRCPECGLADLHQIGTGTQRVEEELVALFPSARIIRMDLDTTTGKGSHDTLLSSFGSRKADILIGTQMVAKGLDFPNVTLVGVISADTGLLMPDFRAEERTFQLLTQVAGRAGRADLPGEVIVQTRNPDRPVIGFACRHDYDVYADQALSERRAFSYPPFGRVATVEFKGPEDEPCRQLAAEWTARFADLAGNSVQILGPEAAFISRMKGLYRYQTMIKAPRSLPAGTLQGWLRTARQATRIPGGRSSVIIDVDALGA
jgi:primosomal protein N' (replication factor Y) (superfamily II helicase)